MAYSIQHVAYNCLDRAAQEEFYTKHLGFRRARVFNAGRADEAVVLRLGGACIELFPTNGAVASTPPEENAVGYRHLAFEVPDISTKVAELNADGIETGPIIDCGEYVPGLKVCFLNDPEGNVLELMEGWQDEADR